jgi:DNA mismatch repair protein MSH5
MTVVYYPQIGYLIAVPLTKRLRDQGVDNMTDLEYHFTSKDMVYYKNERMYELDEKVGDVRTETVDLESAYVD